MLKKAKMDLPACEAGEFVRTHVFNEYCKGMEERCSVHERQICALESRQKSIDQKITATLVFVICSLVSVLTAIGMGVFR